MIFPRSYVFLIMTVDVFHGWDWAGMRSDEVNASRTSISKPFGALDFNQGLLREFDTDSESLLFFGMCVFVCM